VNRAQFFGLVLGGAAAVLKGAGADSNKGEAMPAAPTQLPEYDDGRAITTVGWSEYLQPGEYPVYDARTGRPWVVRLYG
jgi:hypothetical protein